MHCVTVSHFYVTCNFGSPTLKRLPAVLAHIFLAYTCHSLRLTRQPLVMAHTHTHTQREFEWLSVSIKCLIGMSLVIVQDHSEVSNSYRERLIERHRKRARERDCSGGLLSFQALNLNQTWACTHTLTHTHFYVPFHVAFVKSVCSHVVFKVLHSSVTFAVQSYSSVPDYETEKSQSGHLRRSTMK